MYKYFGWLRREKKFIEFLLIIRVDIFFLVFVWIKVIDFIKIYILFRFLKLKVIWWYIIGKKILKLKNKCILM